MKQKAASKRLVASLAASAVVAAFACGSSSSGTTSNGNGAGGTSTSSSGSGSSSGSSFGGGGGDGGGFTSSSGGGASACPGGGTTTVTGTVYDPAGKNPLYDVLVFIPASTPPSFPSGATCDQCANTISQAETSALTGPDGKFTLTNVPAGTNVPIVLQVGKWRRQLTIPTVAACQTTTFDDPTVVRLPKEKSEGDMPQMAIATGWIDPFECLLRKIGIDDSEFTLPSGTGRVHMYQGNGSVPASGSAPASQLSSSASTLESYDVVILPCQASPAAQDTTSIQNLIDYTSAGGRVFATHYSYTWLDTVAPFDTTATFMPDQPPLLNTNATIDQGFPKGAAFAQWLEDVSASTTLGTLPLQQVRFDVTGVGTGSQQWVTTTPLITLPGSTATESIQHYTFNTPVDEDAGAQCGRVVYSDFHVVSTATVAPSSAAVFPASCGTDLTMTPQEKALEFMLFDLSSCIQSDQAPPTVPQPR